MKKLLTLSLVLVFVTILSISTSKSNIKSANAVSTIWWKVAPNTCTINLEGSDPDQAAHDSDGALSLDSGVSGSLSISAFCPVFLPQDAAMNLLRVRTFQSGGLPANTDVKVYLTRRLWSGSFSTLATADMDEGDTYNDASFSSTVDNEDYQYLLHVYVYKASTVTTMPELEMISIRYAI